MTNAKKYLKDGVSVYELASELYEFTNDIEEKHKYLKGMMQDFFNTSIPPTLTEDERVILRNIDKRYKYLYRNNKGQLRITDFSYKEQPEKCGWDIFWGFDHLFQFVLERRRIRDKGVIK